MEKFKLDNFANENRGFPFPYYRSLNTQECSEIRRYLGEKLGLSKSASESVLVSRLAKSQEGCGGIDAGHESFVLEVLTDSIGIKPQDFVFINWYRFDEIDSFAFKDVSKFFHDIWYPGVDDIDIFDSSLQWVLSVTHEGYVQYFRF